MKSVKNYPIILLILVILTGCSMMTAPTRMAATNRPDISHPNTISATYIVQYYGYEVTYQNGYLHVCPLIDQFDAVRIWFGHDPTFPPLQGTPLEEASPLSLEVFANLMTNGSDNACIDLNGEAFP